MWNILTVTTVRYFNTLPGQLKYHTVGTVKIPHNWNSKNIPHSKGQLKYHTLGTVRTFHIVVDSTVWYSNCPRQSRMILLFLHCGILTVHDNV
jgi:hypothetical protein